MPIQTSDLRRGMAAMIAACALLNGGAVSPALAGTEDRLPDIRLTYRDLGLHSAAGRQALVDRVRAVATDHCARYGALIVPRERRLQPHFCVSGVRSEILYAMPRGVRAAYDLGVRQQ